MLSSDQIVPHGRISCDRCWQGCDRGVCSSDEVRLVRDPGHWGSSNPLILVLGISKGNTQAAAYKMAAFDSVAFKGIRDRMLELFKSIGILSNESLARFERRFTSEESDFAFASLIRCSLTAFNPKKGKFVADSPDILKVLKSKGAARPIAEDCVDQYITNLPPRTRLIVLLGNTPAYIKIVRQIIAKLRGPVTQINDVAYEAGGVRFIHVTHPSRLNGHFGFFVRGEGTAGAKRELARQALLPYLDLMESGT